MGEANFCVYDKLNIAVEEAYKVLRTNIQFTGVDKQIKTITIASYNPQEGKTTISINLAISMARAGLKVLLVDADLRKPMTMKRLGSAVNTGLSNYIAGYATIEDVLNRTNVENLYYIACGPKPTNPSELIASYAFTNFLKLMEEQFDMIIIDTPPLGSVIDCAIVAAQTDGTLLVIGANEIEYQNAKSMKEQLEKVNANILGVILNKLDKGVYRNYCNYNNLYSKEKQMNKNWFKSMKEGRKASVL